MKLTEFELDVMQLFWDGGEESAPVIHQYVTRKKDVSYSTVKTIIDRLEDKGALKRTRQEGRTIFYNVAISRKSISKSMLPTFLRRVFGGSHTGLITQLMNDKKLSNEDLDYLQGVIKDLKSKRKKQKGR